MKFNVVCNEMHLLLLTDESSESLSLYMKTFTMDIHDESNLFSDGV